MLFTSDNLRLLRIPFSFFLLPIFCFALSQAQGVELWRVVVAFIMLHLFVYPASNAYNSYMDQDEGPIGGLQRPPKATRSLYHLSLVWDGIGLALAAILGWRALLLVLVYILVSKAYSWHATRLKRYAVGSFLVVALFQGAYTYLASLYFVGGIATLAGYHFTDFLAAGMAFLLTGALYPLTQVYQHKEDAARGDRTLSLLLGIRGTFVFSALLFIAANALGYFYFLRTGQLGNFWLFQAFLFPAVGYFLWWAYRSWGNARQANWLHTMRLNIIASTLLTSCFLYLWLA